MSPAQKAGMLAQMSAASDQLALLGIRMQHPAASATWGYHLALRRLPPERQPAADRLLAALPALTFPVNPVAIAVQVSAILDRLGLRHARSGSFASAIMGEYRTIRDLDVVVQCPEHAWRPLVAALRPAFTFVEVELSDALARASDLDEHLVSVAMYEWSTGYQVDLFLAPNDPYARVQMERISSVKLGAGAVWLPSVEDAMLNGLRWYAPRPSDALWRDVQAMLRVQAPDLDLEYLHTWAAALGVPTLLDQALSGTKPIPRSVDERPYRYGCSDTSLRL